MTAPASAQTTAIPDELSSRDQWVVWRYEPRPGEEKPTKIPYSPVQRGKRASSTDPSTWATFDLACAYRDKSGCDGIGFGLSADDEIVFIDLDHCRNAHTGEVEPWAQRWIESFASYAEVSPSGTGVHILVRGSLPGGLGRKGGGFEIYDRARYATVTGRRVSGTPLTLEPRQEIIDQFLEEIFPDKRNGLGKGLVNSNPTPHMEDDDILLRASAAINGAKFSALMAGAMSGYPSASEADSALCCMLAFYTQDPEQIDRIFRTSGLFRPKWDTKHGRDTYGAMTINGALGLVGEHYNPASPTPAEGPQDPEYANQWPDPLADEALYGLAGDFIRAVAPYSEADPVALLGHLLAGVGALVGPGVHAIAGDAIHPAKLNVAVVGETAKGRKGSAARPVERLLKEADPSFASRIMEGLSSGEGLIWNVRDAIFKTEKVGRGDDARFESVQIDGGVSDKRLCLVESELASVIRAVERDGNTLSAIIRRAWDRDDLRTLTKNSPARATGAHVAIVGHITRDELLRYLDRTEIANGFANRFLWLAVRRGQLLPDGERVPDDNIQQLATRLTAVMEWARTPRRLTRDPEASALWHDVYPALAEGQSGLFGAATSRAEAQVLRLSVLYALLDTSSSIRAEHLLAALAVWRYAEDSARWLFGDSTGDPTADAILSALRTNGQLTRTAVSDMLGRNVSRGRIDRSLALLLRNGLAHCEHRSDTGGRPAEVWSPTR